MRIPKTPHLENKKETLFSIFHSSVNFASTYQLTSKNLPRGVYSEAISSSLSEKRLEDGIENLTTVSNMLIGGTSGALVVAFQTIRMISFVALESLGQKIFYVCVGSSSRSAKPSDKIKIASEAMEKCSNIYFRSDIFTIQL